MVVCPGRTFLRQLFSLLRLTKAPHHFVHLVAGARADLHGGSAFFRFGEGPHFPLYLTMYIPMLQVPMDAGQLWTYLGIFNCSGRGVAEFTLRFYAAEGSF